MTEKSFFRVSFVSEKSRLAGGKKRKVLFVPGASNEESVTAPGILKNDLHVAVAEGLPKSSNKGWIFLISCLNY